LGNWLMRLSPNATVFRTRLYEGAQRNGAATL
jgi:hypothetical protein